MLAIADDHAHNVFDEMHWSRAASDEQVSKPC